MMNFYWIDEFFQENHDLYVNCSGVVYVRHVYYFICYQALVHSIGTSHPM